MRHGSTFVYPAIFWVTILVAGATRSANADGLLSSWVSNGLATTRFEIQGIGIRNNPLRNRVSPSFVGDELFLRFRLRYDSDSIDEAETGNGEFFVFWLDTVEGHDGSGHAVHVPNVGIHVGADNKNRFMVRFSSGSQKFASELKGDQDYLIVGRLWKSDPGDTQPFDKLDLWVDPKADQEWKPHASTGSAKSITKVNWVGFSTGVKTEADDRIEVWDVGLATNWRSILGLPEVPEPPAEMVEAPKPKTISFGKHVVPILSEHCFECHSGEDASAGIRLDTLDGVLNQTNPRDGASSHLVELVTQAKMPPEGDSLSPDQIRVLSVWIDEGMQWDSKRFPTPVPKTDHWAFQPIVRPDVPIVRRTGWVRTPVDAFIAARHEASGLAPNPPADDDTLRRRLSLGLLGLPPDSRDGAGLRIESLLSDPAHGEHWARYWLDVARWAESNGHQHNRPRRHAWRFRDWTIDAMNNDMPFDQFVRKQIAGDLIDWNDPSDLIATGFLSAARYSGNELDKQIQRNDILVDVTNTTASALLGLTMECAQCHTHKFDPISIRDYYRFQAFFADAQPENVILSGWDLDLGKRLGRRWEIFDQVHARMVSIKRKQGHPEPIYVTPKSVVGGMKVREKAEFNEIEKQIASLPQAWAYVSSSKPIGIAPNSIRWPLRRGGEQSYLTSILVRGDVHSRGPDVSPAWPIVFGGPNEADDVDRMDLAEWLVDRRNPLTARVWVNRIWQWHFGRGLVESSGDFGTQGVEPSHPKLLDYLASELIDHQWSTRHVHRLIVHSSTYSQSNRVSRQNEEIDPTNRLLWRWEPRRLNAEVIRDSILAISDQLDRASGGASVPPPSNRRSIYLSQQRERFPHQQLLFDGAAGNVSCSARRVSTSPLQSLWLLNSEFVQRAASKFASRVTNVEQAFRIAIGRTPSGEEIDQLNSLKEEFGMTSVCLAIFNSSEFLYLP